MRILVIGGTSFIGREAVEQLLAAGHEVTVFHRGRTNNLTAIGYREILGDRRILRDFSTSLRCERPDVVLDMIAHHAEDVTDLLSVFAGEVKRIVMISSCNVYRSFQLFNGEGEDDAVAGALSETSLLRTEPIPGDDKLAVEDVLSKDSRFETTILRLPMVYGPGDGQHRFYDLARRMEDGRPVILIERKLSLVRMPRGHIGNVGRAIALAVTHRESSGKIFNVADRDPPTEIELWHEVEEVSSWKGSINVVETDKAPEFLLNNFRTEHPIEVDSTKIRETLGFEEVIERKEGLAETLKWELSNPPSSAINYVARYAEEDAYLNEVNSS